MHNLARSRNTRAARSQVLSLSLCRPLRHPLTSPFSAPARPSSLNPTPPHPSTAATAEHLFASYPPTRLHASRLAPLPLNAPIHAHNASNPPTHRPPTNKPTNHRQTAHLIHQLQGVPCLRGLLAALGSRQLSQVPQKFQTHGPAPGPSTATAPASAHAPAFSAGASASRGRGSCGCAGRDTGQPR